MLIRRTPWLPCVLLAATVVLGLLLQPVTLLTVTTESGHRLVCSQMAQGEPVTLVFTHSMYGGEVRETWLPDGDRLTRTGITTDLAAAAEYYATDGDVERTETGFVVQAPPLTVAEFTVRIDQIGNHRLRIGHGTSEMSLANQIDGSAAARFTTERPTLLHYLLQGCGA